jgi:hypothetical protein
MRAKGCRVGERERGGGIKGWWDGVSVVGAEEVEVRSEARGRCEVEGECEVAWVC